MKARPDFDPGYVDTVNRLFERIEGLLEGVDPKLLPLRVYVGGRCGGAPSRERAAVPRC